MQRNQADIEFDQRLGLRIRMFREQRGLSEKQLRLVLGKSTDSVPISDYEHGTISVPACHLRRIATSLNVPIHILLAEPACPEPAELVLLQHFRALSFGNQEHFKTLIRQLAF